MNIRLPGSLRLGTPSPGDLAAQLERARHDTPAYDGIGATLRFDPIPGEHRDTIEVGRGAGDFAAAKEALRRWVGQRNIGAQVVPEGQWVEDGATVLLFVRRGPVFFVAPNRVVGMIDEPRRFAFAYGTLPGHPERGEEAFIAEWLDDERVTVTIRVAAGAATRTLALVGPILRRVQQAALRRYLAGIAEFVRRAGTAGSGDALPSPNRPGR